MTTPFDPPSGNITHEYKVFVDDNGMVFHTAWYTERYARSIRDSLTRAYPRARIVLKRRLLAGDTEIVG